VGVGSGAGSVVGVGYVVGVGSLVRAGSVVGVGSVVGPGSAPAVYGDGCRISTSELSPMFIHFSQCWEGPGGERLDGTLALTG
jgi:hypothetical protein